MLNRLKTLVLLAAVAVMAPLGATEITLPSTGVDLPGLITALITALGVIVVAVIGGFFAFRAIKIGLRWVGKVGG